MSEHFSGHFTVRNLYLYLVCLITLVISIFALVSVVRSVTDLIYPPPTSYRAAPIPFGPGRPELRSSQRVVRDAERQETVLSLVSSGTTLLVAAPVYGYHWRRIQREHAGPAVPPTG